MIGWHSASWSRGKEPLSGGVGLEKVVRPPGPPNVLMIQAVVALCRMILPLDESVADDNEWLDQRDEETRERG